MESVSAFRKESNLSCRQAGLTPVFITPSLFPKPWSQSILRFSAIAPREFLKSGGFDLESLRSHQGQTSLFSWTRCELLPAVCYLPSWTCSEGHQLLWPPELIGSMAELKGHMENPSKSTTTVLQLYIYTHMYTPHTHAHSSKYLSLPKNVQPECQFPSRTKTNTYL